MSNDVLGGGGGVLFAISYQETGEFTVNQLFLAAIYFPKKLFSWTLSL